MEQQQIQESASRDDSDTLAFKPRCDIKDDEDQEPITSSEFYVALYPHFATIKECEKVTEAVLHYHAYPVDVIGKKLLYHPAGVVLHCNIELNIDIKSTGSPMFERRSFKMKSIDEVEGTHFSPDHTSILISDSTWDNIDIKLSEKPVQPYDRNTMINHFNPSQFHPGFFPMYNVTLREWKKMYQWAEMTLSIS